MQQNLQAQSSRIDVLDVTRGIAILLIFFFNIPAMGNSNYSHFGALTLLGWTPADRTCWSVLNVLLEGTQRGLLELLFGAGALILLKDTLHPNGPVSPADRFFRRNFWLMAFGFADIFGLLWFGDILLAYGFTAIFLFPFRRLSGKTLLGLCLLFLSMTTAQGVSSYKAQMHSYVLATEARNDQTSGRVLNAAENDALKARANSLAALHIAPKALQEERNARFGSMKVYTSAMHEIWFADVLHGGLLPGQLLEAFFSMLLGMSLFKLGITQGNRSRNFYLWLALACYIPGLLERSIGTWQQMQLQALPNVETIAGPVARLAVTVGHLSLINLLIKTRIGSSLLSVFKAPGRTAFSLYLMQNALGCWILFPGFAFGLWGRFGWFGLSVVALALMFAQILLANLWMRSFAIGPLEWLWRSVTDQHLKPFRHSRSEIDPVLP